MSDVTKTPSADAASGLLDRYRVLAEIAVERLRLSGGWLQALI